MVPPRIAAATLAFLVAAGLAVPAARPASLPVVWQEPAPVAPPAETRATSAACTLEPGPIETAFSYGWTSPVAFTDLVWMIPRSACTACGPNYGLEIKSVTFRVRWFGPCAAQAEVSVVGATGPAGCRVPDPTQVLCPPTTFAIVGFASAGALHTLTLPAGCCVGPEAFVRVHFTGLGSCYPAGFNSPGLTRATTACVSCTEYTSLTTTSPTLSDWCTITTNPIWLSVEADCCGPVGVGDGPGAETTGISILDGPGREVRMRVRLSGTTRRAVDLNVYDIAGRRVRSLLHGVFESGPRLVTWDGTSDAGARLPAGVYKVRLTAGGERAVATAILLD